MPHILKYIDDFYVHIRIVINLCYYVNKEAINE